MQVTQCLNIVRFSGVCLDPRRPLVITEYYPRGSLHQLLTRSRIQLESEGAAARQVSP